MSDTEDVALSPPHTAVPLGSHATHMSDPTDTHNHDSDNETHEIQLGDEHETHEIKLDDEHEHPHKDEEVVHRIEHKPHHILELEHEHDDAETASQRSVALSSPNRSPAHSSTNLPLQARDFFADAHEHDSVEIDFGAETDEVSEDQSLNFADGDPRRASSITSAAPSAAFSFKDVDEKATSATAPLPTYPPPQLSPEDAESISSSSYSRKARPESMLVLPPAGPLVLGVALVDFNHLVGPKIEFHIGDIFEDAEVARMLPFLALPDGAHLYEEDYSYFHLVPSSPNPTTIFGISCNRQIAASALLIKDVDVTRSIVQKAVVVLASKPVFGPIRDKLGVVTRALFDQRDFTSTDILRDFATALENSLRSQLTESGLYMGTSLRQLVHTFRHRTLVLLKTLILQKKIMFAGPPVERLCTYQYSLISLIPGLLQNLEDCGSPPLASRAPTLSRPNSLKTSDRKSMMAFMGLPLDLFGKDAFFQPYVALHQMDMLRDSQSWLCGSTNSIVTQQKEVDLLVNTETGTVEFRNPRLERLVTLTGADRKWMDEIVKDVTESMGDNGPATPSVRFKGSDDYLRAKFEEYVAAALSSIKYQSFLSKGKGNGVIITGGTGGDSRSADDFNPAWIVEFMKTSAYEVWDRTTDPTLFDIVEPRHPCLQRPSAVADIGLRLSEGIQDLKLEQQLGPTREVISRTITTGSTNFFKAVEGVRERWQQRSPSATSTPTLSSATPATSPDATKALDEPELVSAPSDPPNPGMTRQVSRDSVGSSSSSRPASTSGTTDVRSSLSSWGAGIQSFWSNRSSRFSLPRGSVQSTTSVPTSPDVAAAAPGTEPKEPVTPLPNSPMPPSVRSVHTVPEVPEGEGEHVHVDLHELEHVSVDDELEPSGMAL